MPHSLLVHIRRNKKPLFVEEAGAAPPKCHTVLNLGFARKCLGGAQIVPREIRQGAVVVPYLHHTRSTPSHASLEEVTLHEQASLT